MARLLLTRPYMQTRPPHDALSPDLDALAATLIQRAIDGGVMREGTVMTPGPPPYRRLDCDGRALAYVKTRKRKRALRVDISGLWVLPLPRGLAFRSATGASMLLQDEAEIEEALRYLNQVVELTRRMLQSPRRSVGELAACIAEPAPLGASPYGGASKT